MVYTFYHPDEPSHRTTQYFEIFARRGVYHNGWVAGTTPKTAPWIANEPSENAHTEYEWELYNITEDFSQSNNLAAKYPEKLKEMKDIFMMEATKYNVFPLDDSNIDRFAVSNRPSYAVGRTSFIYYEGMVRIPEGSAPDLKNKSFTITAEVNLEEENTNGIIVTQGGRSAGFALFLKDGKLVYHYNYLGIERYEVKSGKSLPLGESTITCKFDYEGDDVGGPGTITLLVNGKEFAKGRIEKTIPIRISLDETFDVGEDTGTPASEDYKTPFHFEGELIKLKVDL
jgi:arylsulfatase